MAGAVRERRRQAAAGRDARRRGARPPAGRGEERTAEEETGGSPRRLRRRWVLLAGFLAAVALGAGCAWALYGSSWSRVEKVTVDGTRVLTEQQVLDAARVAEGAPLVTVDTGAVEARLAAELRRIGAVEVERSWPDAVELRVTEREPAVLLKQGDRYVEVDAGGVRFATVTTAPKGVPVARLRTAASPSLDRFGRKELTRSAVRVADALTADLRRDTRAIVVSSYDSVTLELSNDRSVLWGSAERSRAKAKALTAVMKAERAARHFDVTVPSAPAATVS